MDKDKIRVYVVGSATHYAKFLPHRLVDQMDDAELVIFTGGSDVSPKIYQQELGNFTSVDVERDLREIEVASAAIKKGLPIWGTCRGIQLGCAMSGGQLVQHMNHPSVHNITLYDGTTIAVNSLHHQLQHPQGTLKPSEFTIIGYAESLSNIYLNGKNAQIMMPSIYKEDKQTGVHTKYVEPEIVYYRKTNWLGAQHHPELMSYGHESNVFLRSLVKLHIEEELDFVLSLKIPTDRYNNKRLIITDEEYEKYDQILKKRKQFIENRESLVV